MKPLCPDCKGELEQKTGQGGFKIWRCTSFPKCKYYTRKLGKENVSMYSIPEPDYEKQDLRQARRAEIIREAKYKAGEVIVSVVAVLFSAWGVFQVMNWFGESQIEYAKQQQAKMQVDMARAKREAEARNAEYYKNYQQPNYIPQTVAQSEPQKTVTATPAITKTRQTNRVGKICDKKKCIYATEIIEVTCYTMTGSCVQTKIGRGTETEQL